MGWSAAGTVNLPTIKPEDDQAQTMSDEAPSVSPRELYDRIRGGESVSILDVRDRDEFEQWHVDGPAVTARQVPYVRFVAAQAGGNADDLVPDDLDEPIVAVCGVGEASGETAAMLQAAGIEAENLAGGMDAWANLVVTHEVPNDESPGELAVVQYERPATGCLSYLVWSGDSALLVDPLYAIADRYIEDIDDRRLDLRCVFDTHVHADHLSGARAVGDRIGADVVLPEGATDRGLAFDAVLVADGDSLSLGEMHLDVLATPGHTTEHVTLDAGGLVFTGDTVFLDGVGRPDLEDEAQARSHAAQLYETLHDTIFEYPDETLVAPGHVQPGMVDGRGPYVDTLEAVTDRIPIANLDESEFLDRVAENLPPRPANHERIVEYNLGRATIDQSALSLELGPNNCAIPGE